MKTVWGLDQYVVPLVAHLVGLPAERFGNIRALAFVEGDMIVGGVLFSNWSPETGTIEITAASTSRKWMTRSVLRTIAEYGFNACKCQALVARTTECNRAARIWRALGSEEVSVPHGRGRGKPELVFILTDDAWANSRFMRQTHG